MLEDSKGQGDHLASVIRCGGEKDSGGHLLKQDGLEGGRVHRHRLSQPEALVPCVLSHRHNLDVDNFALTLQMKS